MLIVLEGPTDHQQEPDRNSCPFLERKIRSGLSKRNPQPNVLCVIRDQLSRKTNQKLRGEINMKNLILALALFGSAIGIAQSAKAESGRRGDHHDSDHREYNHYQEYDRDDYHEYNWDHSYWDHHHFGYCHHHRGYWTYRGGQHIFINVD
jgi:hypothetical protein